MNLYRELLKNKDYRKLLAANIFGRLGDSIDSLTLAWLTYQVTGSASLSAVAVAAQLLPTVILQPLAAPFVEPLPKKMVMSVCDWLRGGLTAGFLLFYLNGMLAPWMMILFPLLVNSVEAFRVPASVAMLPALVGKEQIPGAVSLNGAVGQIFTIAGSALGGVLLVSGAELSLTVDFVMYLMSGILICRMRREPAEKREKNEKARGYWQLLSGGFRYLGRNRLFRLLVSGTLLFNSIAAVSSGIVTPYIEEVLGQGAGLLQITGLVPLTAGCLAASAALLLWMAGRKDCNLLDEQI